MADERSSIFNKHAADRLRSPDDLDKYVRVTSPSVWVVLCAVAAVMVGLLSWGLLGAVSTNVSATGTAVNGEVLCFLDAERTAEVKVGDLAYVSNQQTKVASVSKIPLSRDEVEEMVEGDYLVGALMQGEWAYVVTFDKVEVPEEGIPLSVSITTERVAPISLVLG